MTTSRHGFSRYTPKETNHSLWITILVSVGAAVLTTYSIYLAAQTQTWQYFVTTAALGLVFLASVACIFLIRLGRLPQAIQLLLTATSIGVVGIALVIANVGAALAISALALTIIILTNTIALDEMRGTPVLGIVAAVVVLALNWIQPAYGLPATVTIILMSTFLAAILAVVALYFLVSQFQSYPIRVKLVLSFTALGVFATLVVGGISYYATRAQLSRTAQQSLYVAASQSAATLDSFILANRAAVASEAKLPYLAAFADLRTDMRTQERVSEVTSQLMTLHNKDSVSGVLVDSYLLLDSTGIVVADTKDERVGENHSGRYYFRNTWGNPNPTASPALFDQTNQAYLYFSARVLVGDSRPVGILVAAYDVDAINKMIGGIQEEIGGKSFVTVIDENHLRIAQSDQSEVVFHTLTALDEGEITDLQDAARLPMLADLELSTNYTELEAGLRRLDTTRSFTYEDPRTGEVYLAAVATMKNMPWQVIFNQPLTEVFKPATSIFRGFQLLTLFVAGLSAAAAAALANVFTAPIKRLADIANRVSTGEISARAQVETRDEVGGLAESFNNMTGQQQQSLKELEQRVAEHTADSDRKTSQLLAAAEVGRAAASMHDLTELLPNIAHLISEQFDFYHVGIFLLDDTGNFAVLRAANSEGGRRMLERGHRLAVGQQGIVGYVTQERKPRIALDVGQDASFFNNPDLPDTRSELALPLMAGSQLLGALDVQSIVPAAFNEEDFTVLQVMADLIAVAIKNASLSTESQQALETTRRAYGEQSRQAWIEMLYGKAQVGFRSVETGIYQLDDRLRTESDQAIRSGQIIHSNGGNFLISIPVKVRDTVVGVVEATKLAEGGNWTAEELETVTSIVEQTGIALESARLFEASRIQAIRERLVSEITARIRETLDIDTVLQTAVAEMRQSLDIAEVEVRLDASQLENKEQ